MCPSTKEKHHTTAKHACQFRAQNVHDLSDKQVDNYQFDRLPWPKSTNIA